MSTLEDFRRAVRAKIAVDLQHEQDASHALRERVLPALRLAIARARADGVCARAWLIGSFSRGEPRISSDVDLVVDGCRDPDALADRIARACGRPAHVIDFATAPESLRERALAEGEAL
jgi:predicted nucleotidyltransferase